MNRWLVWIVLGLACGCEPQAREKNKAERPKNTPNVLAGPAVPSPESRAGAAGDTPTGQAPDPTAGVKLLPVRLSNGIALAQTGPEGVIMTFHVDYRFREAVTPGVSHVWILHRSKGSPAEIPVTLKPEGELETFQNWRPEEGPFECSIEERPSDSPARVISARVAMSEG